MPCFFVGAVGQGSAKPHVADVPEKINESMEERCVSPQDRIGDGFGKAQKK